VEFVEGEDEDMSDMEDYEGEYEFDEDMEAAEGVCQKRPVPLPVPWFIMTSTRAICCHTVGSRILLEEGV
jgi:hypothetical protein